MAEGIERVGAVLGSPYVGSTETFFDAIRQSAALPTGLEAEHAASAVLCALMWRLSLSEARDMIDALPPGLQALFDRCSLHRDVEAEPPKDREQFIGFVSAHLDLDPEDAEELARVVLSALRAQLPRKEVHDVESQLPKDLVTLFHGV